MRIIKLLSLLFVVVIINSCTAQDSPKYDWQEIKEVKFYGRNNPIDQKNAAYVLADIQRITPLLIHTEQSKGYLPKGAQSYATITFKNSQTITIQILPGLPAAFRVVKGKIFEDDWFVLNEKNGLLWLNYITELNKQLAD